MKLQVEFNPALVGSYRLIGYENRTMSAESFADDEKDGGELGSGHTVTALYELIPAGSGLNVEGPRPRYTRAETEKDDPGSSEWAVVGIRWKKTDGTASILREFAIDENAVADEMDDDMSWAAGVALTGMLLEGSEYAGTGSISEIRDRLAPIAGEYEFRQEFLYLLGRIRQ